MENKELKELVNQYRIGRVKSVINHYQNSDASASYFIHIVPTNYREINLDISNIENMSLKDYMVPIGVKDEDGKIEVKLYHTFNDDGYMAFSKPINNEITCYDQLIKNGIYETYSSIIFERTPPDCKNGNSINNDDFIKPTIEKIENGMAVLKMLQVKGPYIICLSLCGMKGGTIIRFNGEKRDINFNNKTFDKDDIFLPPVIIQDNETNIYEALKTTFDIIWQSVGISSCPKMI